MYGFGCSGGCSSPFAPLPAPLPPTQIVEGGVQIRVTPTGLGAVTGMLRDVVNATLGSSGLCIPGAKKLDPGTALPWVDICYHTDDCGGGEMGCKLGISVADASLAPADASTLRVDITINAQASVPVHLYYTPFGVTVDLATCTMVARADHSRIVADVAIGVDGASGELGLHLEHVDVVDINPDISSPDCGITAAILDAVSGIAFDLFATDIGNLVVNLITPTLDGFIQGLLPRPLGLDGLLDVGSFLQSIAPGASSKIEVHGVPGGYAGLPAGGISVGMNVGLNADRDPSTRGPTTSSEPSLCVPAWSAPDLSAPPSSLSSTARGTFALAAAGAFTGAPESPGDFAIGVSHTVLDLAGHHVVAAGTLCLTVGSDLVPQLNLGTVGLIVPSLAALGHGNEPVQVVLRPTAPVTFDLGEGTLASPYLTAHLRDFELDFYALLFERYVRAFTVGASVDVGINLEFMTDQGGHPFVVPTLVGLDASKFQVKVANTALLRESARDLETLFPTLLGFVLPLLSQSLPDIPVPALEGFTLGGLQIAHAQTDEDDFLSISANLVRAQAGKSADAARATTTAQVVRVTAPPPETIRAGLAGAPGGALPEIELALGGDAPDGSALEWQWNLDGGMWRAFSADAHPILRDRAFAIEGKHTLGVRARGRGQYATTDRAGVALEVVIDSMAPSIDATSAAFARGELVVSAVDAVSSAADLDYALSSPAASAPATGWARNLGHFPATVAQGLAAGGAVKVYVRDETGNVATALVPLGRAATEPTEPSEPSELKASGCSVGGGGGSGGGTAAILVVLVLGVLGATRLRRRLALTAALLGACSASAVAPVTPETHECETDADCVSMCPAGQTATCGADLTCSCAPITVTELPVGKVGTYANLAVGSGGAAWVSAYDATYGDLVAAVAPASGRVADSAWEFVDGVPASPVVVPGGKVRGGVKAAGDDVGLYTSIALTPSGEPVIAYYDRTHASLRYAARSAGTWTSYVLDSGAPGAKDVGKYTSITVDALGRPGVAYLALVTDGEDTAHSEVRYAQASRAAPASAADWSQVLVESKAMVVATGTVDDLPQACGLFIASARRPSGDPVVAYYDRTAETLRLASFAAGGFDPPVTLDGGDGGDVGWYPSLAVSPDGTVHVAYVDAARQNLLVTTYPDGVPEVVDDGYRIDGTTPDGQPRPVFHHVGDNSALIASGSVTAIVYQDATNQDLLLARPGTPWTHTKIAGSDVPYKGAYGFYAAAALSGEDLVMSSFVLNQATADQWVEVFRQAMR